MAMSVFEIGVISCLPTSKLLSVPRHGYNASSSTAQDESSGHEQELPFLHHPAHTVSHECLDCIQVCSPAARRAWLCFQFGQSSLLCSGVLQELTGLVEWRKPTAGMFMWLKLLAGVRDADEVLPEV